MVIGRFPEQACPVCKHLMDAATAADSSHSTPEPEDVTVCLYCFSILRWDKDMLLHEMSIYELHTLPFETIKELSRAQGIAIKVRSERN